MQLTTLQRLGIQAAYERRNKAQRELVEALTELGLDPAANYSLDEATSEFTEMQTVYADTEQDQGNGQIAPGAQDDGEEGIAEALTRLRRIRTPRIKGEG